jgi:FkbM family methyltransferase
MKTQIVLFGAGEMGRRSLDYLRSRGITPVAFADSKRSKWWSWIDGIQVMNPESIVQRFPDARWVAAVLSLPASQEVPAWMRKAGVKTLPLWSVVEPPDDGGAVAKCGAYYGRLPRRDGFNFVMELVADDVSRSVVQDQYDFYSAPDYDVPSVQESIENIYFPEFISRLDDEVFVDCGAADGDSIAQFIAKWPSWRIIAAIEPDIHNIAKLSERYSGGSMVLIFTAAVGDKTEMKPFLSTGNYCSRLGTDGLPGAEQCEVRCYRIDDLDLRPSFIKMDIEGSELDALEGARQTIQKYSPVLAICGYHTVDHFWQVPALIHEIRPDYKLFLRRYAPAPFELIVYGVPEERISK